MMNETMFGNTMWAGHWLWMLVVAALVVVPFWRICRRLGFPGALSILILIPIVNIAFLYFIAFSGGSAKRE